MSREERKGHRKTRNERTTRIPELGYYLIVTDAVGTEPNFFNGIKDGLPKEYEGKLVIKIIETRTENLIEKCMDIINDNPQYRIPCIVFDRDRVKNYDKIILEAEKMGITVGWSNPCFEIWMYAYFDDIPYISESKNCCNQFSVVYEQNTGVAYSKNDKDLYKRLVKYGNEDKAIERMKRRYCQHKKEGKKKPSSMCPCSTVYKIVSEINEKTKIKNK